MVIGLLRCPLAIVGMLVDSLLTARVARRAALCVDAYATPEQVLADYEAEIDAHEPPPELSQPTLPAAPPVGQTPK